MVVFVGGLISITSGLSVFEDKMLNEIASDRLLKILDDKILKVSKLEKIFRSVQIN